MSISKLFCLLRPHLPSSPFSSDSKKEQTPYVLFFPIRATCPTYPFLLDCSPESHPVQNASHDSCNCIYEHLKLISVNCFVFSLPSITFSCERKGSAMVRHSAVSSNQVSWSVRSGRGDTARTVITTGRWASVAGRDSVCLTTLSVAKVVQ